MLPRVKRSWETAAKTVFAKQRLYTFVKEEAQGLICARCF